jgi:hypothetical protein
MSSFVRNNDSNATKCTESDSHNLPTDPKLTESDNSSLPVSNCKTLAELASETLACSAAEFIKSSSDSAEAKEVLDNVKNIEEILNQDKNSLALVFVLDNTASQSPSWALIQKTIKDLIPFLDSRHGETKQFSINYEIIIIYANDYTQTHMGFASSAKRCKTEYIANPRETGVVGELARISSNAIELEKEHFLNTISKMECYGGSDSAEAYSPALDLALEHVHQLKSKYGDKAVVATIFCGDDIPHGCSSQKCTYRDNWEEGDPSGIDWFEVIESFPCPIHCLSPPHADADSRCALGYASKKTGGFHITIDSKSSIVLLRLLMAEMKLSWLVERNLKDMESATPEEISAKIAEIVNKESFVKPSNTVPEDPRLEKISEEMKKSGPRPYLMRSVSSMTPNVNTRTHSTVSTLDRGVSDGSVMRALRTATGGCMAPSMIRQVSDSVARTTNTSNEDDQIEDPPFDSVLPSTLLDPIDEDLGILPPLSRN